METKSENVMFGVAAAAEAEAETVEAGVVSPIVATARGRPKILPVFIILGELIRRISYINKTNTEGPRECKGHPSLYTKGG